ncbi:MAG TPA: hypothetical protein VFX96_13170 [Pyrinomonadaceae bacterium]|nr:hypothetical protein [Pyrinomonadaceae bacterium]
MLLKLLLNLVLVAPLAAVSTSYTQGALAAHADRAEFAAASEGTTTIDFDSVAPARGFGKYRPDEGLTAGGVTFRASGGARFGPGLIYVVSTHYGGGNPMLNTGTLPLLTWAAPNQPGNASLDVTLPAGTTAVGCDLWTQQPYVSTIEVTATTSDGQAQTVIVNTRNRPAASFVGFTSDRPIVSLSFRPPKGVSGLLLDNFTYGRRSKDAPSRTASASAPPAETAARDEDAAVDEDATQPAAPRPTPSSPSSSSGSTTTERPANETDESQTAENQTDANQAAANQSTSNQTAASQQEAAATSAGAKTREGGPSSAASGTIAYARVGKELRLISPDGSNDRKLWAYSEPTEHPYIYELAWRPDGKELTFSSSHHSVVSLYHADIYGIRPDGAGFRRITNAPDHSTFARYPQGTVTVTLRNQQPFYLQQHASVGVFFVYVAGASEPQAITMPPGSSKTLVFKSVADFGEHAQPVVAMYGNYRWFIPGVDVKAGRNVNSTVFGISGDGYELFGAFRPVWRSDGSRLSFRNGLCLVNTVPAQPTPGEFVFQPLFAGKHPSGACAWDWGPTPALANQIIYTDNTSGGSSIYRIAEGGTHPGAKLTTFSDIDYQLLQELRWLPDGSGFLYSFPSSYESSNIFRYDFASKRVTQVTRLENEFARSFAVSPDGRHIVFERAKTIDGTDIDLWLVGTDGRGARLLVRNGHNPAWGK